MACDCSQQPTTSAAIWYWTTTTTRWTNMPAWEAATADFLASNSTMSSTPNSSMTMPEGSNVALPSEMGLNSS
jgi:hypothetical protein